MLLYVIARVFWRDIEVLKIEGECVVAVTPEYARTLGQISPTTLTYYSHHNLHIDNTWVPPLGVFAQRGVILIDICTRTRVVRMGLRAPTAFRR